MRLEWTSPVAVGGVGGSGTRLIARMLMQVGLDMGTRLNDSLDDLDFGDVFVNAAAADASGAQFDAMLERYLDSARTHRACLRAQPAEPSPGWGWKAPNTHLFLERIVARIPGLHYLHVMRSGLDMAYSPNLNQLRRWGPRVLGREVRETPADALAYWVCVHRRILSLGDLMGRRFLLLNYDMLCDSPGAESSRLLRFLGVTPSEDRVAALAALVQRPPSRDRHAQHPTDALDPHDVEFVRSLGFAVR